ncbi:carboxymuconolactone decarboxylase family protein [uncultured Roseibium sp.]|uniref:carboxymuconolactone decarboxylase family protein n=1 Tax=uncultured Roseibium sp. TaxID=1936171 RepID=UPI00261F32B4|nr:carboxymuconolactone decarboxylase family protein [uncultured Roseibium sp.]
MPVFSEFDEGSSIGDILFSNIERFGPLLKLAENIMRSDGPIPVPDRELIAAYVSGLNACKFCQGVHKVTAQQFGVPIDLLGDVLAERDNADIDRKQRALLNFARKLTLEPSKVTEQDRALVVDAGNDPDALKDLIAIVSLFSFFNRLVDGHGIEGGPIVFDRDAGMLRTYGYMAPAQ